MKRCPRLAAGGSFTRDTWGRFADWIDGELRAATIQTGQGYTVQNGGGGVTLNIKPSSSKGGSTTLTHVSFDITDQTIAGAVTLTFWPGTINGIMPSNMFTAQTVDATSLWYVIATATTDGSAVTGIVLSASTTAPTPQTAATNAMPSTVAITVGIYKAGAAYNIAGKNITMTPVQINQAAGGFTGVWGIA